MLDRHRIALAHPCARANDALHPRFRRYERHRGLFLSTMLTVNK